MPRPVRLLLLHALSLSRLGMAAAFLATRDEATRAALVGASGLSDVLDGWLARRFGLTTPLGAILDPACDRAFVLTAVVALTVEGRLSPAAAVLLLLRDLLAVVAFGLSRAIRSWRRMDFRARLPGKLVTLLQFLTLFAVLLWPPPVRLLVAATAVLALGALVDYARQLQRSARRPSPPVPPGGPRPLARQGSA